MWLQILRSFRCLYIGTSSSLLLSFAAFQTVFWKMTLAKVLLPLACGDCLESRASPFEGSRRVFVPLLLFLWVFNAVGSDRFYHWQAEWWSCNWLKYKAADLHRRFPCQSSHICEPLSAESRLSVRVKTHLLVLSHGFLMFWQLKPGQNNCKDNDSPCGESKLSIRSSPRERLTNVST